MASTATAHITQGRPEKLPGETPAVSKTTADRVKSGWCLSLKSCVSRRQRLGSRTIADLAGAGRSRRAKARPARPVQKEGGVR